jgi:3-oxosteroid 1-dehydrogenase
MCRRIPSIGRGRSGIASSMTIAKVLARAALGRLLGRDEIGCGASLAGQLMAAALRLGADVRLDSPLVDLIVQGGRAKGLITHRDGLPWRVATRYGVLLAGGGFAHARDLRQRLQGTDGSLSSASPDDTGDMLKLADRLGAMTALLDQAWWATSFLYPGGVPGFFQWERALPFSVVVNSQGARFGNESGDYDSFAKAMIRNGLKTCWLIMDARHRQRYTFGAMSPGVTPEEMIRSGFFHRANTLEELAHKCGISPGGLLDMVARFNGFVDQGVDRDFRRGDKPYDRHWGDPTIKPNPCLGKIERGPFLAAQIHIGDLGTRGGFVTDEHGRVLDVTGRPIDGLYAAGNCTAAVVGNAYPGPGVTLGPAMTFAYLAMQHASHPNDSAVVA